MKSTRILTRKTMGLDRRVWRVMIFMLILTSGLLGYKLMDTPKCTPVDFKIKTISDNDSVYYTDEILSFRTVRSEKKITWDFNDNTGTDTGTFITHRFATEGKYYIKVTVNSNCEFVKPITIKKAIPVPTETVGNEAQIIGHDKTFVRISEVYTCSKVADYYEWNISEHPEYGTRTGASATYKFEEPTDYTIELTLNKDRLKRFTKTVKVVSIPTLIPDKPQPVESKNNKILLSEKTFKDYLEKVISGAFFAKDFDKYLCSEGATPVVMNGKAKKKITFTQACEKLNGLRLNKNFTGIGKRAARIKNVRFTLDAKNCITLLEINYE